VDGRVVCPGLGARHRCAKSHMRDTSAGDSPFLRSPRVSWGSTSRAVQRLAAGFPSWIRGFDSRHRLHVGAGQRLAGRRSGLGANGVGHSEPQGHGSAQWVRTCPASRLKCAAVDQRVCRHWATNEPRRLLRPRTERPQPTGFLEGSHSVVTRDGVAFAGVRRRRGSGRFASSTHARGRELRRWRVSGPRTVSLRRGFHARRG
jgi:hypothetical protein